MNMELFPTKGELEEATRKATGINKTAVLAMISISQAAEEIRTTLGKTLESQYRLSEGKLHILLLLYRQKSGLSPSSLAKKSGVTKATVSVMIGRMKNEGLVSEKENGIDRRGKQIALTESGRIYVDYVLPQYYLRLSQMMKNLTEEEQKILLSLLHKLI